MGAIPPAVAVGFAFFLFASLLSVSARLLLPVALQLWPPAEPLEVTISTLSPIIALGHRLPMELAGEHLPLLLVVHVECLGCRSRPPENVVRAFSARGVRNLVLASDTAEYVRIARQTGGAQFLRGGRTLARQLHAAFGPRVYAFDANSRLVYVQNYQARDIREPISEARKAIE